MLLAPRAVVAAILDFLVRPTGILAKLHAIEQKTKMMKCQKSHSDKSECALPLALNVAYHLRRSE